MRIIFLISILISVSFLQSCKKDPSKILMSEFSVDNESIIQGNSVSFTDLSTGDPVSWEWTFPDAVPSSSTLQNPTDVKYNFPGTYNVILKVTNEKGKTHTTTKTSYITVGAASLPILTTKSVTKISTESSSITQRAESGGIITSTGGSAIMERGLCWNTSPNPTIAHNKTTDGSGTGSFESIMTGLTTKQRYYVRAYAKNIIGVSYGNQIEFIADNVFNSSITYGNQITDVEGNKYYTVQIGTQIWMAEDLRTSKFNDGTAIPHITDNGIWSGLTTGGWGYINGSLGYSNAGKLYNWYSVNTGKLCPTGWKIPSLGDALVLINYLGGLYVAGEKMKTNYGGIFAGTGGILDDEAATNSSGFSGELLGYRRTNGTYTDIAIGASYWTSTPNGGNAMYFNLYKNAGNVVSDNASRKFGFFCRCLKN